MKIGTPCVPSLPAASSEYVYLLFHRIADEYQRLDGGLLILAKSVVQDAADLRIPALTINPIHTVCELLPVRDPFRCAAFVATVINELRIKLPDRGHLPEHFGLKFARDGPRRCPTCRRVQGEHQRPRGSAGL